MANVNVVNLGGKKVGEFELLDEVFAGEINDGLLWESVKHYRAALRQGTASTKTRGLVSGAGRKLDEKLYLGSRNLAGVELVLSSEVHPYDLLRYEHAVFSKDAIEALQETLKKFVSKRSKAAAQKEVA